MHLNECVLQTLQTEDVVYVGNERNSLKKWIRSELCLNCGLRLQAK